MNRRITFKNFLTALMVLLFQNAMAQSNLTCEAGSDTVICNFEGYDTLMILGGNPTALGGVPPYNYHWDIMYTDTLGNNLWTTANTANPLLYNNINYNNAGLIRVFLQVSDANGATSIDSLKIRLSTFIFTLDYKFAHIDAGDSVMLYKSAYGGIEPWTVSWSPGASVTDSSNIYTYASPANTTSYQLNITDFGGCSTYDSFDVFVNPLSVSHSKNISDYEIYPNPASDYLFVNGVRGEIFLRNVEGKVQSIFNAINGKPLDLSDVANGTYFLEFEDQQEISVHKLVILKP
ncbi:MAG: T9SS type A sorting domain-containing protein [Flavobacteriales bacterium]|nr:T9SS type A sorting domain-containing protein [Flavobacteriales bacterium]